MIPSKNLYECSEDELGVSRKHSVLSIVMGNLPYAVMILLRAIIIALGLRLLWWAWIAAGTRFAGGVLSFSKGRVRECTQLEERASRSLNCLS